MIAICFGNEPMNQDMSAALDTGNCSKEIINPPLTICSKCWLMEYPSNGALVHLYTPGTIGWYDECEMADGPTGYTCYEPYLLWMTNLH